MKWFTDGYQLVFFVAGATAALCAILMTIFRSISKWRKHRGRYDIRQSCKIDDTIHQYLEELRERTRADRVHVYRFHNGADFFDGTAMKRLSCSCEVTAPGVSREVTQMQQIPLSLFSSWQKVLLSHTPHIHPVTELENDHYCSMLTDIGVKAICVMPLLSDKLIVGALCAQYPEEQCVARDHDCKWYDTTCVEGATFCTVMKHYASLIEVELAKER